MTRLPGKVSTKPVATARPGVRKDPRSRRPAAVPAPPYCGLWSPAGLPGRTQQAGRPRDRCAYVVRRGSLVLPPAFAVRRPGRAGVLVVRLDRVVGMVVILVRVRLVLVVSRAGRPPGGLAAHSSSSSPGRFGGGSKIGCVITRPRRRRAGATWGWGSYHAS